MINDAAVQSINIIDPDIQIEASDLLRGITRVDDIRQLTQAFISQRLANSSNMESTKSKALQLLSDKLDSEEAKEISITKLMEIIGMISEHTSTDVSNMVAAFAAQSGQGKGGKGGDGSTYNVFFGSAGEGGGSDLSERVVGAKSTFKILDALDAVAQSVVHNQKKIDTSDAEDA